MPVWCEDDRRTETVFGNLQNRSGIVLLKNIKVISGVNHSFIHSIYVFVCLFSVEETTWFAPIYNLCLNSLERGMVNQKRIFN